MLELSFDHLFAVGALHVQDLKGLNIRSIMLLPLCDLREMIILESSLQGLVVSPYHFLAFLQVYNVLLQLGVVHRFEYCTKLFESVLLNHIKSLCDGVKELNEFVSDKSLPILWPYFLDEGEISFEL